MSQRPTDIADDRPSTDGRSRAVTGVASGCVLLVVNTVSIGLATWWAIWNWVTMLQERGYWSLWPLFWIVGSGILLVLQVTLSVLPSLPATERDNRPVWLRRAVVLSALAGVMISIGGVAAILIYDHVVPAPHHTGP